MPLFQSDCCFKSTFNSADFLFSKICAWLIVENNSAPIKIKNLGFMIFFKAYIFVNAIKSKISKKYKIPDENVLLGFQIAQNQQIDSVNKFFI